MRVAFTDLLDHAAKLPGERATLLRSPTDAERQQIEQGVSEHGRLLAQLPRQEEVDALLAQLQSQAAAMGILGRRDDLLVDEPSGVIAFVRNMQRPVGMSTPTFPERVFRDIQAAHSRLWQQRVATLNWELHDVGMGILESSLIEAILSPDQAKVWAVKTPDPAAVSALVTQLAGSAKDVLLWRKTRLELVNEMNGDLQMPGWGNIWTQPIINRVNMLATGVRTQIGVKVFGPVGKPLDGPDGAIAQAQKVGEQIAARLKQSRRRRRSGRAGGRETVC